MYELCCDMIDLLINMSEIYGQPNGNNALRTNDEEDEDDEYLNEGRENYHEEDNEHHEWNLDTQNEYGEDDSVHMNGVRSNSYLNSKSYMRINHFHEHDYLFFFRSSRYNTCYKSSTFIID